MTSLAVVQSATPYPLAAYGRTEVDWDGVIGGADVIDNALDTPGGSLIFVDQSPKSRVFTVRIVVVGTTETTRNDSLAQLRGLVDTPTAPVLFRRVIPIAAGTQTAEAYAYLINGFRPVQPREAGPNVATLALDFRMLSAAWYDTTTSLPVAL